ncbi:syncoilin-like isoform X2 [Entelurus aequoreus]|uniref:syncoilin-like isoform X2 n=1 Tax=Entelurus aequoreus TaxID=161455 RepID=UPI002B1E0507|nr:syncoilin-like isoform X2 [Entelurus aequoreus]
MAVAVVTHICRLTGGASASERVPPPRQSPTFCLPRSLLSNTFFPCSKANRHTERTAMEDDHLAPLFIHEEEDNGDPEGPDVDPREQSDRPPFTLAECSPALLGPYLHQMDDLLQSCEDMTDISFCSHLSGELEASHWESSPYFSTSCTETQVDKTEPSQGGADVSHQADLPLTLAGNRLSDTMMEYEGRLLGMLAVLESCMEDWEASPEDVHVKTSPEDVHVETSPEDVHVETSPEDVHVETSTEDVHVEEVETSPEYVHVETSPEDVHVETSPEDVHVETSPEYVHVETSPEYVHVENCGREAAPGGNPSYDASSLATTCEEKQVNDAWPLKMDLCGSEVEGFEALRCQMEECIQEVQRLESRRRELLSEVLQLRRQKGPEEEEEKREAMEDDVFHQVMSLLTRLQSEEAARREERKREIRRLRATRAEEERRVWQVDLETQEMRQLLRKLKWKLFARAKESAHAQLALSKQRHEVALLRRQEETLQTVVLQMTDESVQLKLAHQRHLLDLLAELHLQGAKHTSAVTQEEMCRRHSHGDIQQYLQASLAALHNRYEPMLLALLKRKETTTRSCAKSKEQTQELRAQLRPLEEETQKLLLQRACMEEKVKLTQVQRKEDAQHYQENIRGLEESSRVFKTELMVQKRKNKEAEDIRDSLSKQILLYRSAAGDKHTFQLTEEI